MAQYKVDLSEIEKAYRIVGKATESQSAHPGDHVKAKFEQFEAEFRPLLEKLKARVDALDPKFASFSEFFGTDTKEMPLEGFLTLLYDFVLAFDTAKEKQAKAHAEAERQTRIEARRKAAEQVKSSMLDTAVLIQEIRQKRQQKNVNSGQIQVTAAGKKTTAELHSAVRTRRGTRTSRD